MALEQGHQPRNHSAHAHVIGDPLEALEKIDAKQTDQTHQNDHAQRDQRRNGFDRFKLHCGNKTKKPGQHKAALALESDCGITHGLGGGPLAP